MEKIVVQCSNSNHKIQLSTNKVQSFIPGQLNFMPSNTQYQTQFLDCLIIPKNDIIYPQSEEIPSKQELKESVPQEAIMEDFAIVLMSMVDPVNHQTFTSPLKQSNKKEIIESGKFSSSSKIKMFKQLSNKQNKSEEPPAYKIVSKNSIKKQITPSKLQFQNQFPKKKVTVTPFTLFEPETKQKSPQQNVLQTLAPEPPFSPHQRQLFEQELYSSQAVPVLEINNNTIIPTHISIPESIKYTSYEDSYLNLSNTSILNSPKLFSEFTHQYPIDSSLQFPTRYSIENKQYFEDNTSLSNRQSQSILHNWRPSSPSFHISCTSIPDSLDQKYYKEAQSYSFIEQPSQLIVPKPKYQQLQYIKGSFQQQIQSFWLNQSSQYEEASFCSSERQAINLQDFIKGKRLGKGMFGQVFVVQHKTTGFLCAMKVLSKQFVRTQNVADQLIQQLKIHMFMDHPNIVGVYGFFSDFENVYILQQLCTSGQLFDILVRRRRISQKKTAHYIRQMVDGLDYIHSKSVVHRDIKPENILLQFGVVKIGDFGWAAYSPENQYTNKCGTPLYYSPEVIRGQKYSRIADNWGIGVICYELVVGNIPWSIWTEDQIYRIAEQYFTFPDYIQVSNKINDFIDRILTKYPKNRMTLDQMLKHSFLSQTNPMHYHNQMAGNYGELTP